MHNIYKENCKSLIVAVVFSIIVIFLLFIKVVYDKKEPIPKNYNTLISKKKDSPGKYVGITITDIPYKFAMIDANNNEESFYIVFDKDNHSYIVNLNDNMYKDIFYGFTNNNINSYEIKGYIFSTSKEIETALIKAYNNRFTGDALTEANFEDYFGKTYLDTINKPYDILSMLITNLALFFAFLSLVNVFFFAANYLCIVKELAKYKDKEIETAINNNKTISFASEKLYLTNKYLVLYSFGLIIAKYREITKMITDNSNMIILYTKDNNKIVIKSNSDNKKDIISMLKKHNRRIIIIEDN